MGEQKKDPKTQAIAEAKACYSMGSNGAWFEALLTNSRHNYRTPEGRMQIKDGCFDDIVKPQLTRIGTPPDEIEQIRNSVRKR